MWGQSLLGLLTNHSLQLHTFNIKHQTIVYKLYAKYVLLSTFYKHYVCWDYSFNLTHEVHKDLVTYCSQNEVVITSDYHWGGASFPHTAIISVITKLSRCTLLT